MDANQTINLNQTAAQCIHTSSSWGKEVYYNICNGTQTEVPWGSGDWAWNILGYGFVAGITVMIMVYLAVGLIRWWKEPNY